MRMVEAGERQETTTIMTRRDFIGNALAALGFSALPGGFLFAAPEGWKPGKRPNLVFGVISDTHLRTSVKGEGPGANWPDKYFSAALKYFKRRGVDAVVHCGDMAHRGQVREMEFHAEAWSRVFGGVAKGPARLFITGNHDAVGAEYGDFVKNRYPDEAERAKHVLATDMAANWERIWGEKYENVWHKEVKGYHFFGRHWSVDDAEIVRLVEETGKAVRLDDPARPFFFMTHSRPVAPLRKRVSAKRNVVSFFGHNHDSIANWNMAYLYYGRLPCFECASCEPRGCSGLVDDAWITKAKLEGGEKANTGKGRQGYVVCMYDDMMVLERHEFSDGEASLGADWVMPLGKRNPHPLSKDELKKVIGEPQFRKGARMVLEKGSSAPPCLRVKIPRADGNPDSRVYAYEVEVSGEDAGKKLLKAVYAAGCNMGIGHEPNHGTTTLEIPRSELPSGKTLTFTVTPLTSLGTRGCPLRRQERH